MSELATICNLCRRELATSTVEVPGIGPVPICSVDAGRVASLNEHVETVTAYFGLDATRLFRAVDVGIRVGRAFL